MTGQKSLGIDLRPDGACLVCLQRKIQKISVTGQLSIPVLLKSNPIADIAKAIEDAKIQFDYLAVNTSNTKPLMRKVDLPPSVGLAQFLDEEEDWIPVGLRREDLEIGVLPGWERGEGDDNSFWIAIFRKTEIQGLRKPFSGSKDIRIIPRGWEADWYFSGYLTDMTGVLYTQRFKTEIRRYYKGHLIHFEREAATRACDNANPIIWIPDFNQPNEMESAVENGLGKVEGAKNLAIVSSIEAAPQVPEDLPLEFHTAWLLAAGGFNIESRSVEIGFPFDRQSGSKGPYGQLTKRSIVVLGALILLFGILGYGIQAIGQNLLMDSEDDRVIAGQYEMERSTLQMQLNEIKVQISRLRRLHKPIHLVTFLTLLSVEKMPEGVWIEGLSMNPDDGSETQPGILISGFSKTTEDISRYVTGLQTGYSGVTSQLLEINRYSGPEVRRRFKMPFRSILYFKIRVGLNG